MLHIRLRLGVVCRQEVDPLLVSQYLPIVIVNVQIDVDIMSQEALSCGRLTS